MRAKDVMTTDVITVGPDVTVQDFATLLAERGISGAPVTDSTGQLVGIVSEGDLLHRAEIGAARRHRVRRRSWWLDHYASENAREYVEDHGRSVRFPRPAARCHGPGQQRPQRGPCAHLAVSGQAI